MTDFQKKELEGRYANRMIDSADTYYEFTKPQFSRYDALSTGYSSDMEILIEILNEFKTYNDPKHKRFLTGTTKNTYPDYKLDYNKCVEVTNAAHELHMRAYLIVIFWDQRVIWDLDITDWNTDVRWEWVNKTGVAYGKKELQQMSHIPIEGPQGPIRFTPINNPDEFWKEVAEEIKKDHPDYTPSWIK